MVPAVVLPPVEAPNVGGTTGVAAAGRVAAGSGSGVCGCMTGIGITGWQICEIKWEEVAASGVGLKADGVGLKVGKAVRVNEGETSCFICNVVDLVGVSKSPVEKRKAQVN